MTAFAKQVMRISIHALRKESDAMIITLASSPMYFNPRSP